MYSAKGWIVGSSDDPDKCDLQVAKDSQTGISGRHFRIDVAPYTHCPRLKVLSKNSLRIYAPGGHTITLNQGESLEILSAVQIDLGKVAMRAWRPSLSSQEGPRYKRNADKFSEDFLDGFGRIPLRLDATPISTSDIRFGLKDAVYKPGETVGTGMLTSVIKVEELRSGSIFAAKVPHYRTSDGVSVIRERWESVMGEYQNLVQLKHVGHSDNCVESEN